MLHRLGRQRHCRLCSRILTSGLAFHGLQSSYRIRSDGRGSGIVWNTSVSGFEARTSRST